MTARELYHYEKAKRSYELHKAGRVYEKVRAIVRKGDKYMFYAFGDEYVVAGGGVDDGETPEQAIVRECQEELLSNVKVVTLLSVNNFTFNCRFNDIKYVSKRREYFYLCEWQGYHDGPLGVEGEFVDKPRLVEIPLDEMIARKKTIHACRDFELPLNNYLKMLKK